jgi:hypothetical protein
VELSSQLLHEHSFSPDLTNETGQVQGPSRPPVSLRNFPEAIWKGMAMATQTGFAASKVLILVGAGPPLAVNIVCSSADWMRLLPISWCFVP